MNMATVVDGILVAAESLSREKASFAAEDLVVRAWQLFPDRFGLQGYSNLYPDSNRVLTKIMGASGRLRRDGLMERVGTKKYRLTSAGHVAAAVAKQAVSVSKPERQPERLAGLNRDHVAVLRRLLSSQAFAKFVVAEPLSFSEAAAFLNISARSTANQLNVRWSDAETALQLAEKLMGDNNGSLPGGAVEISPRDITLLRELLKHISAGFARDLAVIRSRTDERHV